MTTAVIIQARLGSKRFPRKVLADLAGKPVLERVLERCKLIGPQVILAVPYGDNELTPIAERQGAPIFFGPKDDVLKRYFYAANAYAIDIIMRITADCPLIDPDLCRETLELYEPDYTAIGWPRTYPRGYGCEVFSKSALDLADKNAITPHDREHVTPWIEWNLKTKYLTQAKDESELNYCVDSPEDIERLAPFCT